MKILLKEPTEIKNPYLGYLVRTPKESVKTNRSRAFKEGIQAALDQMIDVELDKIKEEWAARVQRDYNFKNFTEYLKEQLNETKPDGRVNRRHNEATD